MPNDSQAAGRSDYVDVTVEIGPPQSNVYPVTVSSDAGDARGSFSLPFEVAELKAYLANPPLVVQRDFDSQGQTASAPVLYPKELGQRLFNALFTGTVRRCYDRSRGRAEAQQKQVRLVLKIDPDELAVLPWEFLYDADEGRSDDLCYVSLSNIPIVRYPRVLSNKEPLAIQPPLRILGMAAIPKSLTHLDVKAEQQKVETALKDLTAASLVELVWLAGETWEQLKAQLEAGAWHIFHFIGHGGPGEIAFASGEGQLERKRAAQVTALLDNHPTLRLVLLNSCEGAKDDASDVFCNTAATLVERIPAVLAMQYKITDQAAIQFAHAFYQALAACKPVDAAVADGREALFLSNDETVEWGTPVLYMRSQNGLLFNRPWVASDPDLHWTQGQTYAKGGDHAKAIIEFTTAITINPAKADYYLDRAASYVSQGERNLALVDFGRASALLGNLADNNPAVAQKASAAVLTATAIRNQEEAGGTDQAPAIDRAREVTTAVSAAANSKAPQRLDQASILWVDDHPDNNRYERRSLEALGVRFTLSTSTKDAVTNLEAHSYDVIISDMSRPPDWRAGYTLLTKKQKLALNAKTPYIIYAGSNSEALKAEILQKGGFGRTNNPRELFQLVVIAIHSGQ